jgi:hypothetical protein
MLVKLTPGGPRFSEGLLFAVTFLCLKFNIRGFSLDYSLIFIHFDLKTGHFWLKQCSIIIRGFDIRGSL